MTPLLHTLDEAAAQLGGVSVRTLEREIADAFRAPYRPSLDRIKASGGYTLGNVRLVCTAVN